MRVVLALVLVGIAGEARPCASCQLGDPTLTAFGTEQGFENRLRVALDLKTRSDRLGADDERVQIDELRSELGIAWAPNDWLFIQLATPLVTRRIAYADAQRDLVIAVGDLALRSRFSFGDFDLSAGLSLPTAPTLKRNGVALPIEAQPGSGSFDPSLGVSWSVNSHPWAGYVGAFGTWPTGDANVSLRLSAFGQRELWRETARAVALRLVIDLRVDGKAREDGALERDSGGFIGFIGGDIVASPAMDWVVSLGARVPVIQGLSGEHEEGIVWAASLAYDLN